MTREPMSGFLRPALAGLSANLVTIGLARFAYTPLIPALIGAAWFTPAEAAWLRAGNLAGYSAGGLVTSAVAAGRPAGAQLRGILALAAAGAFAGLCPPMLARLAAGRRPPRQPRR